MLIEIINSILPVFILIFVGWCSIRFGVVGIDAKKVCAKLVSFYVFPALLFMETAKAKTSDILDYRWLLAFLTAMMLIWLVTFISSRYFFKERISNAAMQSMLCAFPNMGGMGIPFLSYVIGSSAIISVAKANFIVSIILIPLTIILLETDSGGQRGKQNLFIFAFSRSLKTPMFLAVVIGVISSFSGFSDYIPQVIFNSIDSISKACMFVSLFTVGLALYRTKIRFSKLLLFNLLMKSLFSGFIAWFIVTLFGIQGDSAREMVYLLAMPTATIATVLAVQWNARPEEATSIYFSSTLLSLVTLPLFMYLLA
ncbi:AEC family transporter [Cysteiniphilum halobium]|uniref:AEC family transporter n=1 Tax=Cysteiniphilum halobium TaxID=2219059 RepID=UPI003F834F87